MCLYSFYHFQGKTVTLFSELFLPFILFSPFFIKHIIISYSRASLISLSCLCVCIRKARDHSQMSILTCHLTTEYTRLARLHVPVLELQMHTTTPAFVYVCVDMDAHVFILRLEVGTGCLPLSCSTLFFRQDFV